VWFNAWKYQNSEQIWAGMAHCIISQITARMNAKQRELFWLRLHARRINADEVRRKIYQAIAWQLFPLGLIFLALCAIALLFAVEIKTGFFRYLASGLPLLSLITLIWKAREKLGDKAVGAVRDLVREPSYEGKMGYLHLVESDIRDVLDLALITNRNPLVLFVDDLDRCAPAKVAEIVEAINLFLCGDYPNCIFVIGMEPGMVAAALEVANKEVIAKAEEMGVVDGSVPVGWRFMEKIVQLPITIPPPTTAGLNSYVRSLTGFLPHASTPTEEGKILAFVDRFKAPSNVGEVVQISDTLLSEVSREDRWAAAEASRRVYEQTFSERDPLITKFVEEVANLLGGNPRQIKRYVNVFRFYSTLRHGLRVDSVTPGNLPSDAVLAKFVALCIYWPHAMDCLRSTEVEKDGSRRPKKSLLELFEERSKALGDDPAADSVWREFVDEKASKSATWATSRTFRLFLSRGESFCGMQGHGLW
jgi:hypothetical protein